MRNYYVQIQQYSERLIQQILQMDRKGIKNNGDTLSLTEILLLKALGDQQEKRMADLIQELNLDRNAFGTLVNRLQSQNYVIKQRAKDDKRAQVLLLTDKGRASFEQILLNEKELLLSLLNDFTFNEEKAILKFLVKLDMLKRNNI